jgi:hypothetical protein
MTPYKFVYGKSCHLPFELEHKAYWAKRRWILMWMLRESNEEFK